MIILYGAGPGFGLPEISPYVTKTEVQLQLAGLGYRKERAAPSLSPKGQLPFVNDDGDLIGDSTFIRAHIEQKYGIDLDDDLTPRQRAETWAIERMLENHFGWTMIYTRWIVPENFSKGPANFFNALPDHVRDDAQGRVAGTLYGIGVTRHCHDEITALGDRSLLALSELLADQRYLMGDRPTGVDATAFAMLAAVMTPFFDSALRDYALEYANLVAYTERMMALHFPDHAWPCMGRTSAAHSEQVD
jgi:glutathione S-transferase